MRTPLPAPDSGRLLTVFYDASCPLCATEMGTLARLDTAGELGFVDCADPGFDDAPWAAEGAARAQMLTEMHVRDALGDWHRGVDAIALLYATVGAPVLARLWAHPWVRPLLQRLYPWLARHRHALSTLGLHLVAPRVLRLLAWRQARHARCAHGACRMPPLTSP
jgi:predicted DCC family thiol-disulfide oxidoreductase YuxK